MCEFHVILDLGVGRLSLFLRSESPVRASLFVRWFRVLACGWRSTAALPSSSDQALDVLSRAALIIGRLVVWVA